MLGKTRAPVGLRFARAGVGELSVSVHRLRRASTWDQPREFLWTVGFSFSAKLLISDRTPYRCPISA
jgi:hypothetical protein